MLPMDLMAIKEGPYPFDQFVCGRNDAKNGVLDRLIGFGFGYICIYV